MSTKGDTSRRPTKKKGTAFEQAVADIVAAFGNTSDVKQGKWIDGPDGRRDRDVSFLAEVGGVKYKALIECKDFNPRSTGRVGIKLMDELDSKRTDLNVDISMICSNAGFTKGAINKARRVGITTIAALRMNDDRVKYRVTDTIYSRKIKCSPSSTIVRLVTSDGRVLNLPFGYSGIVETRFKGLSLFNWVVRRIEFVLGVLPVVNCPIYCTHRLLTPLVFQTLAGDVAVSEINVQTSITGAWYQHDVIINATNGLYDWVRKRAKFASRSNGDLFEIRGFNPHKGKLIKSPPEYWLRIVPELGEFHVNFMILNQALANGPAPQLEDYIVPADRVIPGVLPDDPSYCTSTPGYTHDPMPLLGMKTYHLRPTKVPPDEG